jgi:hypothetical protein
MVVADDERASTCNTAIMILDDLIAKYPSNVCTVGQREQRERERATRESNERESNEREQGV